MFGSRDIRHGHVVLTGTCHRTLQCPEDRSLLQGSNLERLWHGDAGLDFTSPSLSFLTSRWRVVVPTQSPSEALSE